MIILDAEPPQGSKAHDRAPGVTLRFPERAAGRAANANASALTLPDYETSQALAQDDDGHTKPGKRSVESRCVVFELYIGCAWLLIVQTVTADTGSGGRRSMRSSYTLSSRWSS